MATTEIYTYVLTLSLHDALPISEDMATGTLADWLVAIDATPGVRGAPRLRAAAEAELRKRLVYEGTRLDLVDDARAPWWMMASGDEMAIKTLDAVPGRRSEEHTSELQ